MNETAITVENLGKRYRIGHRPDLSRTFREAVTGLPRALVQAARRLGRSIDEDTPPDTFWALRDVSFQVEEGEAVAVIGRNGAGKSTVLKILSQITAPTRGRAVIRGRLASLLEVGTGFHPELTGRENIYLNGAMLGMKRTEIARKFDAIVAFSEVEKFLDTPVKRYSSGMYVRLAFAVAAHLEPEILVIDEVLAVGDAEFQRKCLGKMGEVAGQGRTVLFVSHNMAAVKRLCQRAVLLKEGRVERIGPVNEVVDAYLSVRAQHSANRRLRPEQHRVYPPDLEIVEVEIVNANGEPTDTLLIGEPFTVRFHYLVRNPELNYSVGATVVNNDGIQLASTHCLTDGVGSFRGEPGGFYTLVLRMENVFMPGQYFLNVNVHSVTKKWVDAIEGVSFTVAHDSGPASTTYGGGIVRLNPRWTAPTGPHAPAGLRD